MYSFLNGGDFKSYLDTVDVNTELFHLVYMLGYSDYCQRTTMWLGSSVDRVLAR